MRHVMNRVATGLVFVLLSGTASAVDQRFAVRFGLVLVESTASADTGSVDGQAGGEIGFELYALQKLGVEFSAGAASGTDIQTSGTVFGNVTFSYLTLGVNWHPIRTESLDWSIGVLAGRAGYTELQILPGFPEISIDDDTVVGAQTSLDIPINPGGHWAVNVGLKYIDTKVRFAGATEDISFDPLILRVMGVFRW